MPDETPEHQEAPEEPRIAAGKLRPLPPEEPQTTWNPEADPGPAVAPRREAGTLEQRGDARRRAGVRRVYGMPSMQAFGWTLLLLGGLIYLHGLWATTNAVLAGRSEVEQMVAIGGLEILQGTLGLVLATIGLLLAVLFAFLPVRDEPLPVPGTLEFEVGAENLLRGRIVRRVLIWSGVVLFLIGLAIAAFALRETILRGELYRLSLGGLGYRLHLLGFLLAAIGLLVALPLALAQATVERAAMLAAGALEHGRVRRRGDAARPEEIHPTPAPEERRSEDWLAPEPEEEEGSPERRLSPRPADAERAEPHPNEEEDDTRP